MVTADGQVRIANACTNPDLFWGAEGRRRRQPRRRHPAHLAHARAARTSSAARSPTVQGQVATPPIADLIERFIGFYRERLFNPHWGEQVTFRPDNTLWHRHGVPGSRRRRPRLPCGARSSTGHGRTSRRLHAGPAADDCGPSRATLLGCRLDEGQRARLPPERRPAGRARRQRLLAHQSRRSRLVHPGLRIGLAAGSADRACRASASLSTPCSRARGAGG